MQSEPDIQLLWLIGSNAVGQIGNAQAKVSALTARRGDDLPDSPRKSAIVRKLRQRMRDGGLVVVQQDIYPNPTSEHADLILPAAGWSEEDFARYTGERRLRIYSKLQDPPAYRDPDTGELERRDGRLVSRCLPDWRIFQEVARALLPEGTLGNGLPSGFEGDELSQDDFAWKNTAEVFRDMARNSNRRPMLGALEAGPDSSPRGHQLLRRRGTEGYVLPLDVDPDYPLSLREHKRVPVKSGHPYASVKSDWTEIADDFEKNEARDGEFYICNGRVNELWNSMFTNIRNETVRQRWPDDMPGTVLEMNPADADEIGVQNGDVVRIECDQIHLGAKSGEFTAVVSRQPDFLPRGVVFAMFSYPAMTGRTEEFPYRDFTNHGYVNNVTTGYVDPINPIGAVKYARGRIIPTGEKYPADGEHPYLGLSHQPRNVSLLDGKLPLENATRLERLNWQMRELIVQKGLVRAVLHPHLRYQEQFRSPDEFIESLKGIASLFAQKIAQMKWPRDGRHDRWEEPHTSFVHEWAEAIGGIQPSDPEADMLALIRVKQPFAQNTHSFVNVDANTTLQQLFQSGQPQDLVRILDFLRNGSYDGKKLVVPRALESSEFYRLITTGVMTGVFVPQTEVPIVERWINSLEVEQPLDPRQAMVELLQAKRGAGQAMHDAIVVDSETLSDKFREEKYDEILNVLENGKSTVAPYADMQLVVARKPAKSAFYLQLSAADGQMLGVLDSDEIQTVENWIMSLEPEEESFAWDQVATIKIHPAIGIAPLGNAGFVNGEPTFPAPPADYFVGPERPFESDPPAGGYKRDGRVRRQAARFRLFA